MRSTVHDSYCEPAQLEVREVDRPAPRADELLVRVEAAGVNIADWYHLTGTPYVMRFESGLRGPKQHVPGTDVAGVVETVGHDVTEFRVGDEVFGEATGSFAEYAVTTADKLVAKPANMSFEQVGVVPVAGLTALQGLQDQAELAAGQSVLVNGAGGGIGTFAVQIAKALGAEVTGVCSTAKVDLVRSIGADHVIDYTQDDFVDHGPFDVIADIVGNRSPADLKRALAADGLYVSIGAPRGGRTFGPTKRLIGVMAAFMFGGHEAKTFVQKIDKDGLQFLADLMEAGTLVPVVGRAYPLAEAGEALDHVEGGHATGKVVVTP